MTATRLYLSPPHLGEHERQLLLDALDSNWLAPLGPHVDAFEREVAYNTQVQHAAALSSGTAALHLALRLLGIGAGDQVFVSTLTFVATANVIAYCGAEPVFIDSSADTWNMDPALLEEALRAAAACGKLPKAVLVVDLYGQCADYDALLAACALYNVPLIEDAAEAMGATYKGRKAGSFGCMAVFSFNGNKIITTSGGGMLLSHEAGWVGQARFLASQARDPAAHYQHSQLGFNYRLSNLLAAVGRGQLRCLETRVYQRRAVRAFYHDALGHLSGIVWMPEAPYGQSNGWLTCCTLDASAFGASRDTVCLALERANIEARPVWKPLHMQPLYAGCRTVGGQVAEALFRDGLCLPSGSAMTTEDLHRVVAAVLAAREP